MKTIKLMEEGTKVPLTKEQRHEVYKATLKRYQSYLDGNTAFASPYLCDNVNNVLRIMNLGEYDSCDLPEFQSFKPVDTDWHQNWWPVNDRDSRIAALNWCIEQTYTEPVIENQTLIEFPPVTPSNIQ